MKFHHLLFPLLMAITATIGYADYEWKWANAEPTGYKIHDFYFSDPLNGWIASGYGELFNTGDGGNTWNKVPIPRKGIIRELFFLDPETGWCLLDTVEKSAISYSVQIPKRWLLSTENRGKTWSIRYMPDSIWGGLFFTSKQCGWIGGFKYRTVDGGLTWQPLSNPITSGMDFMTGQYFIDSLNGFITFNNSGQILRTSNAGASWEQVPSSAGCCIDDITFYNRKYGWSCKQGYVLASNDSGKTWIPNVVSNSPGSNPRLQTISCIDSINGWAGGRADAFLGLLFRTTDNAHWNLRKILDFNPEKMQFVSKSTGWAGQIYTNIGVFKSIDSGLTWKNIITYKNKTCLSDAAVTSSGTYWTAGRNGSLFRSNDSCRTWTLIPSGTNRNITKIGFYGNLGCALCDSGTVLVTSNGGTSWSVKSCGDGRPQPSIAVNHTSIWVVRDTETVYRSNDSGQTWNEIAIPANTRLKKIVFTSKDTGFIFTKNKFFFKTVDGGIQWKRDSVIHTGYYLDYFEDCYFINSYFGYASFGNFLVGTPDGGDNWTTIMPAQDFPFTSNDGDTIVKIYFKNIDTGFVMLNQSGSWTTFYRTDDGCRTWKYELSGEKYLWEFNSFCFVPDLSSGCVVGDSGVIAYMHDYEAKIHTLEPPVHCGNTDSPPYFNYNPRLKMFVLGSPSKEDLEMRILNLKGKTVAVSHIKRDQRQVALPAFSGACPGVYIIKISGKSILFVNRLLKSI